MTGTPTGSEHGVGLPVAARFSGGRGVVTSTQSSPCAARCADALERLLSLSQSYPAGWPSFVRSLEACFEVSAPTGVRRRSPLCLTKSCAGRAGSCFRGASRSLAQPPGAPRRHAAPRPSRVRMRSMAVAQWIWFIFCSSRVHRTWAFLRRLMTRVMSETTDLVLERRGSARDSAMFRRTWRCDGH